MIGSFLAWTFLLRGVMGSTAPLLPTAIGTTWEYDVMPEAGLETLRIDGVQKAGDKDLLTFSTRRAGALLKTNLIAVTEQGIFIEARSEPDGRTIAVDPPQKILATPLQVGTKWQCGSRQAGAAIEETCEITGEEAVQVPAGKFRALRIRGARSPSISSTIERWFVPGVGFVKEVMTTRGPNGNLLQRTSLELRTLPRVTVVSDTATLPTAKKISLEVASTAKGESAKKFSSVAAALYARWKGHGLRPHAKVRAVWIAEDVGGIAPPNYKIDEASTIATSPDSRGVFTLSRPESGWAEGKYRVELYVDENLIETVRLEIGR